MAQMKLSLAKWFKTVGIMTSNRVQVIGQPGSSGLFSCRTFEAGSRIVAVPRSAVFSSESVLCRARSLHDKEYHECAEAFEQNLITTQLLAIQPTNNSKYELTRLGSDNM